MTRPYELLATIYDEYWGKFSEDYVLFLADLKTRHTVKLSSVIDLACGTGSLMLALSGDAERLVGLDISPEMVNVARAKCEGIGNIELLEGDFRCFALPHRFTLALCCFDAINYVAELSELDSILAATGQNLSAEGFFVFDAVTEPHYLVNDGGKGDFTVGGVPYHFESRYDRQQKVNESKWVFKEGTEIHRQMPIEYGDIVRSAERTGFVIVEALSDLKRSPIKDGTTRIFYVLQKGA